MGVYKIDGVKVSWTFIRWFCECFEEIRMSTMLKLSAYFDETGHSKGDKHRFVGMAGLVAPADRWEPFESEWTRALAHFGIPYFHMREFAHSVGVFKDWKGKEDKRRELYGLLMRIIATKQGLPIGSIIPMEELHSRRHSKAMR
jgi:hypothetical protein